MAGILSRPQCVKGAEYTHNAAVNKKLTWLRECIAILGKINEDLATMVVWS